MKQAPLFRNPGRHSGDSFSRKVARHDKVTRAAAETILESESRYGGAAAGLVVWAKMIARKSNAGERNA